MKTLLKLGNITVGNVSVSDITIEQEYTATDVVELAYHGKSFVKELIKELPEVMDDLYSAFEKFNELDKKAEEEIGWEITSVSHSVEEDKMINFDYDLAVARHSVRKYIDNNIGNPHKIVDELNRLNTVLCDAFVNSQISIETYKAKSSELDKLFEMFNEHVRSF